MPHIEGNFKGQKNLTLYYQGWLPEQTPKAVLLIVHGLAEHSGRYKNVVEYFVPKGYAVYGFDQRGHGRSDGARCYVDRFSDYIVDLHTFVTMVRGFHPGSKLFLVGHSIGGTIATAYATQYQSELAGLVLSGAGLKAGDSITPLVKLMARILSAIFPRMGVSTIDASAISRDKAVVDAYVNDPLVYRGKVSARLGNELLKLMDKYLPARIPELKLPLLIMNGTEDHLMNKEGSTLLYNMAASPDKTLKFYEGFYHEIYNEPERGQVFADVEAWLARHI
jgi:alpha-beta hydrolase superfamily lysophospholipase